LEDFFKNRSLCILVFVTIYQVVTTLILKHENLNLLWYITEEFKGQNPIDFCRIRMSPTS